MDPWLEAPSRWSGFHDTLVIKTVEVLQPQLRTRGYYANPGERVWVAQSDREIGPDVVLLRSRGEAATGAATTVCEVDEPVRIAQTSTEYHEGFVEIYDAATHELVTCLEFISPANKSHGQGRDLYEQKRQELAAAGVHLVEVDLLRRGPHVLDVPAKVVESIRPWDYLVNLVRRGSREYEVYPIRLRDRLPRIRIPLRIDDADAVLDLQDVLNRSYDISPFPERCHYDEPPMPALSADDAAWAEALLRQSGLRTA
jgi:hypothetical protein